MSRTRVYESSKHRFFDNLVVLLAIVDSLAVNFHLQLGHHPSGYAGRCIEFEGVRDVSGVNLVFPDAHSMMLEITAGKWPTTVKLIERPITGPDFAVSGTVSGIQRLQSPYLQSVFVHYYETVKPLVEMAHGKPGNWPATWEFSRVVRNAFSHGGVITIHNPNAATVQWKSLSYTAADNGRQLLFTDLAPVELILLMEDMDAEA